MADVDITIGAKDAASKAMTSVGRSTANLSKQVDALSTKTGKLESVNSAMMKMAGAIGGAYLAIKGAQAAWAFIDSANAAFLVQDKAARGATDAQMAYASQLQRVVGVGDEVTLGLMKQAEQLGINKDFTDEVATAAIGYSKAMGTDAKEALKMIVENQGDFVKINEIATRGLEAQKEAMQGLEGVQTRATNSWGDMLEVVGQILAPIRAIVSQGFAVFAEVVQTALAPAANLAKEAMGQLPAIFEWVNSVVIGTVTAIEVVIGNFPLVVEAAVTQAQLYWIQLSESVKHAFTVVMPAYLNWFGENWTTILTDIFQAGLTIVQNRMRQYADIIMSLWDWVSSGFQGGAEAIFSEIGTIASRNLLEGFEVQTAALPEIVARQMTDKEMELKARIGEIGSAIGTEFSTKFTERMNAAGETFEGFSTKVDLSAGMRDFASKNSSGSQSLQASSGRLLTRGRADDPNAKIVDNTKATVRELQEINRREQNKRTVVRVEYAR